MIELSTLGVFALAALGLLVIPGPAVIYITTRSIDQGLAAGFASVLGITTGTLVHTGAAALGLSAIVASSALAFNVIKLVGAAYLIYLGVRRMLQPDTMGDDVRVPRQPLWRIYRQGIFVNLLNPKTALFMFAFLPQFVDPARGPVQVQILVLGALLALLGLLSDGTYALLAARFGRWLRTSPRFARSQRYVSGGILVGLGVSAALTSARK